MLLAMTEAKKPETAGDAVGIRCLTSSEMKQPVPEDGGTVTPRNQKCPLKKPCTRAVLPLGVISQQVVQLLHGPESVVTDTDTPEFGEFNTKLTREQGQSTQPATTAIYTPLIDMTPADPDTMSR